MKCSAAPATLTIHHFTLLFVFVALGVCLLSHPVLAQNVQTTDPRIATETGARVCHATQMSGADAGAKIMACDAALGTAKGTIYWQGDGTISDAAPVDLSSNHDLVLGCGTLTTTTTFGSLRPKSNTAIRGSGNCTQILESTAPAGDGGQFLVFIPYLAATTNSTPTENIHLSDLLIKGANPDFASAAPTIHLGNCHNCSVRRVTLLNTRSIGINAGGSALLGANVSTSACNSGVEECRNARNVTFADNLLIGVASQNLSSVNGQNIVIENNKIINPGQTGGPGCVPIDIEANHSTDRNRHITIKGNLISAAGSHGILNGIVVQNGAGTPDFGPVIVDGNTVIGARMSDNDNHIVNAHIYVTTATNTRVTNNKLVRGYYCLRAEGVTNSLFEGNEITSCGFTASHSIYVLNSSGNVFRHNTITIDSNDSLAAGADRQITEDGTSTANRYDGNLADALTLLGTSRSSHHVTGDAVTVFDATSGTAPFVVGAGTAKVSNLDADKLDGQEGSFYQDASNLNAGTVAPARLGSGAANSNTFLRGDGTWATPPGSSASGWTDDGPTVRLTTATDNVGIGTTTPLSILDVNGPPTTSQPQMQIRNGTSTARLRLWADTATGLEMWKDGGAGKAAYIGMNKPGAALTDDLVFSTYDGGVWSERMRLQNSSGNVGIGTTSPDQTLTVNGNADKPGGGSWAVFSDERLKTVNGRFTRGLKAVMQLQPLRYEYKQDNALGLNSGGEHIGFGAQAVQKIIPEAVTENGAGYLLVNNDPIMWAMLNAIKEQQKEIEQLKEQVRQLRSPRRRRPARANGVTGVRVERSRARSVRRPG